MGWISNSSDHEGSVANVLADGRVAVGWTGGGVIVRELTDSDRQAGYEVRRYPDTSYMEVIVPWDQVAIWRIICSCGWSGSERAAVTDAEYDTRHCPEELEDSIFFEEWKTHIKPIEALFDLEQLFEDLYETESLIREKVQLARAAGTSWSQIGLVSGLSKQGAQQRWGSS